MEVPVTFTYVLLPGCEYRLQGELLKRMALVYDGG